MSNVHHSDDLFDHLDLRDPAFQALVCFSPSAEDEFIESLDHLTESPIDARPFVSIVTITQVVSIGSSAEHRILRTHREIRACTSPRKPTTTTTNE